MISLKKYVRVLEYYEIDIEMAQYIDIITYK
jgi:hypothetical protein